MVRRPRALLAALLVVGVLTGCAGDGGRPSRDAIASSTSSSTSKSDVLPPDARWEPGPGEPAIDVKLAAARAVEAVGTYEPEGGTIDAAQERLAAAGLETGFADSAAQLLGSGAATADVVYPQLSGLAGAEAGVMLVVDITRASDGEVDVQRHTLDVRVASGPAGWRATAIAVDQPAPSDDPSASSVELADSPVLDLPVEAGADLRRGAVDDRLVALLAEWASEGIELGVSVFSTGHPANVFATDRQSNHTAGRAVDIYAVGGRLIAANRESPVIRDLVDRALAAGATEIGAPFDPDGRGGRVFTNTVHQDHLHIAFER